MPDVICMGELLVEFVATRENVSLEDAPGFIKAPGGAPANVAVAARRLGLSSGFLGKVGDDPFGNYLRRALSAEGVETGGLMVDSQARTTSVFVTVWDDGHKDLCFYRNSGADMLLRSEEVSPVWFQKARCFHYGSISFIHESSASAQRRALELAQQNGLMITYDPNYRPTLWPDVEQARTTIQDAFRYCHMAKISQEEWPAATGRLDLKGGIDAVLARGVELLAISRGADGAAVTNGDYFIEMPAYPVQVVETTGAGDGFMAAMIARLLPEREKEGSLALVDREIVREALRFASAVGALTCMQMGAIPALPGMEAVQRFMNNREKTT